MREEKGDMGQGNRAGYGVYIYVWIALVALLGLNIALAELSTTHYRVAFILFIAALMAVLDLGFFMNLRLEGKFLRNVFLLALLALISIILLTFSDVWYR